MADKHTKDALPCFPLSEPKASLGNEPVLTSYAAAPVETVPEQQKGRDFAAAQQVDSGRDRQAGAGSEPACVSRTSNSLPCPPAEPLSVTGRSGGNVCSFV